MKIFEAYYNNGECMDRYTTFYLFSSYIEAYNLILSKGLTNIQKYGDTYCFLDEWRIFEVELDTNNKRLVSVLSDSGWYYAPLLRGDKVSHSWDRFSEGIITKEMYDAFKPNTVYRASKEEHLEELVSYIEQCLRNKMFND